VVVPLLNEEGVVEELITRVTKSVQKLTQDYEIILVDDGSQDATWEKIDVASNLEKRIKGLRFSRNFGHHYAITAGLREALGEWVVVMDGDLQDRPEVIPELYQKAQEGYEVVFVSRENRPERFYYKLAQRFFYWTLRFLSGIDFDSTQANFSIINERVVKAFNRFPENARFYGSTIKWLGFKRTALPATHGNRFSGKTSYTFRKRLTLALDIIIAFSDRPLKFAIGLGAIISATTVLAVVWIFM
jgi:glycosyltransferase involved in cell wall biosynthesis